MGSSTIEELFRLVASRNKTISETLNEIKSDIALIRNSAEQTLLHVAAGYGNKELARLLIGKGADVNAQDNEGQAPLHNACCHGHSGVASILIEEGATVDLTDNQGWSPLHFAVARKDNAEKISAPYWKVIKLLLDNGADPYLSSKSGRTGVARIKNSDDRRNVRLLRLFYLLKDHLDDPEAKAQILNEYVSIEDFFELIKDADENLEVIKLLTTSRLINSRLESCGNITPLHRAAGYNRLETAQYFISQGAKVDETDNFGRIPLHNASEYGHLDMIELLVNEKSNINKQDLWGKSPLHVAAENENFEACISLKNLGADINIRCAANKLPYDIAESDALKEILKPLSLRQQVEIIPSTSEPAIYYVRPTAQETDESSPLCRLADSLMLDSSSSDRLYSNTRAFIKKITLDESDWRYREIKKRMLDTIMVHVNEAGGRFKTYDISSIELVLNQNVWSSYKLECQQLENDFGVGSRNERLLFHGSQDIDSIQNFGFDEKYAKRGGMFGAGIYFAEHSSKSNQYTFGFGSGCREHKDKSCYICERKMIYAQVALGKTMMSKEAMPECNHGLPGFSSITGSPECTENLKFPEYVIYNGKQAYPLFVITYRIRR